MAGFPTNSVPNTNRGDTSFGAWQLLTPSDTVPITPTPMALMIVATGAISITDNYGNDLVLSALAANVILPLKPQLLKATGTTATVWGLY